MRQTSWKREKARREVHKAIKRHGPKPIGHQGYTEVRQLILDGKLEDEDLR
jgi:hypothetical protein